MWWVITWTNQSSMTLTAKLGVATMDLSFVLFSILKYNKGRGMLPYFKAKVLQYMYEKHRFFLLLVNRIKSLGKMVINH